MDDKEFYLDAIRDVVPEHKEEQIQDVFYSFLELEHLYDSAIELVKAQLNILTTNSVCGFSEIQFTISKAVLRHRRALWESCSGKACRLHRKVPATI